MRDSQDLLTLRAQLAKQERAARRAPTPVTPSPLALKALKPQREAELEGVSTDDHSLRRAHARLREAVYEGRYRVCAHVVNHARAEGFLEQDVIQVLASGRVKAVYPEDHRWLVAGYFEVLGIVLPLHVVVEFTPEKTLDVVTAFVPKHPHQIISRARLAVMLRYDDEKVRHRLSTPGNKAGNRGKGRWKRTG